MATAPATTRLPNIKGWVYDGEDSYCRVEDEEAREMVTDAYDPAKTYKKGETRIQDNKLYRAKVDITTAEIWTPDHWEETSLETIRAEMASELSALNANKSSFEIKYMHDESHIIDLSTSDFGTAIVTICGIANGNIITDPHLYIATAGETINHTGKIVAINGSIDGYVFTWIDGMHIRLDVSSGAWGTIHILKLL